MVVPVTRYCRIGVVVGSVGASRRSQLPVAALLPAWSMILTGAPPISFFHTVMWLMLSIGLMLPADWPSAAVQLMVAPFIAWSASTYPVAVQLALPER